MLISPRSISQHSMRNATETTLLLCNENRNDLHTTKEEEVTTWTLFWEEFYTMTRYTLPVVCSQILEVSMTLVPLISIGHLSTAMLAAFGLASMTVNATCLSVLRGLLSSLDTLLPSAYTSPHPQLVGLWVQRMAIVTAITLLPIFLIWIKAEPILLALKQDPEVAHLAAVYLRWLSLSLPALAFNRLSRHYFQSQGFFFVQVRVVCIAAPLNVLLNYALVWGPQPIRLGFIGAPIAFVLSSYVISIASLVHGAYFTPRTAWHPPSAKMFTKLGLLSQLGLAGIAQFASEWWAWELVGFAASFIGPAALASHSIIVTIAAIFYQFPYSIASIASIRIGNFLGEKDARRAGVAANTSLAVSLTSSILTSAILLLCCHSWAKLSSTDPAVINLVASVIPLVALFQVVEGNSTVTGGVLRAKGKQVIGAFLNLSAYYMIGLPIGIWLAFAWNMGLHGLWIGLTLSLVYCSVIGTILCFGTDWDREVLKVLGRISKEERSRSVVGTEV